jgi:hypothetical protein
VLIVDDHLARLRIAGRLPDLDEQGPVATTTSFQLRLACAVADSARSGSLSRRLTTPTAAVGRVLRPPGHRLVVLDPPASMEELVGAIRHLTNLLLAELVGAALKHGAAVRVTPPNVGRNWSTVMGVEGADFGTL